jgi:hypothetical protein
MQVRKLPFSRIFRGTPEHLDKIRALVLHCNRVFIHASHFTKYYLLHCPSHTQVPLDQTFFETVTSMLNDVKYGKHGKRCSESRVLLIEHLNSHMQEYQTLAAYQDSYVSNFQQLSQYMSTLMATNVRVNVQENFFRKFKRLITTVMRKRVTAQDEFKSRTAMLRKALFQREGEVHADDQELYDELSNILPQNIHSKGVGYDVAIRPLAYLGSYIQLAQLYMKYGLRLFNAVPLSTSIVPRHITIDTKILMTNILGYKKIPPITPTSKAECWDKILKLGDRAFRKSAKGLSFQGMIRTDMVSVSLIMNAGQTRFKKRVRTEPSPGETYLDSSTVNLLNSNCVVIDPNKRDLLYCRGSNGKKLRYTQQQRKVESKSKKYKKIRAKFIPEDSNLEVITGRDWDQERYREYLKEFFSKFEANEIIYMQEIFRKLRLDAYINTKRSESKFMKAFTRTYGKDASVVIGDWDSHTSVIKGHVPTKGRGFRDLFRTHGFKVFLLDEYRTSKICPHCYEEVSTFKKRFSPRPWKKDSIITVHGLLRCQSVNCQQSGQPRLWNRDDLATLNQLFIVQELLHGRDRLDIFKRFLLHSSRYAAQTTSSHEDIHGGRTR